MPRSLMPRALTPYLCAGPPFKRRACALRPTALPRAMAVLGWRRSSDADGLTTAVPPGVESVRSTIIKFLKRGTVLVAVVALTLLAVRAWDSQRGPSLRLWHTY